MISGHAPRAKNDKKSSKIIMPMQYWKAIFGFALLLVLATLAGIIAVGHVQQATSYGLEFLLGSLSTLSGAFAQWAFGNKNKREKDDNGDGKDNGEPV